MKNEVTPHIAPHSTAEVTSVHSLWVSYFFSPCNKTDMYTYICVYEIGGEGSADVTGC